MPYAVEMYLDAGADRIVRELWRDLEEAGLPNELEEAQARPHISLMCYDDIRPEALIDRLAAFADKLRVLDLIFSFIGVFPKGIVFWGVNANPRLLRIHADYQASFADFQETSFALYRPGTWVPHCTLAMGLDTSQIAKTVDLAQRYTLPIVARLETIALVEFAPTREWAVFDLKPPCERSGGVCGQSD